MIQCLNIKTVSADRGSKARSSFGNLYAIYVLLEDYINHGFHESGNYQNYDGVIFSNLFRRQRELPFGQKLQNHALNHRLNQEFRKFFPTTDSLPIIRDPTTNRYWFNENLLTCEIDEEQYNIAICIIKIIEEYISVKQNAFHRFIQACESLKEIQKSNREEAIQFISGLLRPQIDARLFEIVSYCILKYHFHDQIVYFGFEPKDIREENLKLYKTGRTNANDGGIDFVMKPLGRFFQVTETTDVRKYFLDIDKIEKYPITFVIKSTMDIEQLKAQIEEKAQQQYPVNAVVRRYMNCIEDIINLPILMNNFHESVEKGYLSEIMDEIIKQSKVEFNIP